MSEIADIRERIARRTEGMRTVWLCQIRRRYLVWMLISEVFAVVVVLSAVAARSIIFQVVAAFLCMFWWNRWAERRRVEKWLSRPVPENQQDRIVWARIFYHEMSHPSLWMKMASWISAIIAIALVGTVSVVVLAPTDLWTRLLYGLIYLLMGCFVLLWLLARRQLSLELKTHVAPLCTDLT